MMKEERTAIASCIDKLKEELSCAICLEICFEPSTTRCGHRKCLQRAAANCGKKCPKCRQLISFGQSRIVNVVMWNTIRLLFPQEVEARKIALKNAKTSSFYARRLAPLRRQARVNVQPSVEFGFGAALSRFSPGDVIEMRLEVIEKNHEEMTLAMKELKLARPTNQTSPSSSNYFSKILNITKTFCM